MAAEQVRSPDGRMRARQVLAWVLGGVTFVAGATGIVYVLSANGAGDSGPVVGPGAARKIQVLLELGPGVIIASIAVTWFGLWTAREATKPRLRDES
jgi:hypothetical protein